MSVFSMMKRSRQAAKDHRADQAAKEKNEAAKPPYKHVPKHAATDAMSGGPAGWRENDRQRILEQNRRRSAMTASGVGMLTPVHSMPRLHSTLSHVSYPAAYASPIVSLPRNYSYGSMLPGWAPPGREMSYSPIDMGSVKGKEIERIMDSSRSSRSSSRVSSTGRIRLPPISTFGGSDLSTSPVESSSGSTSSQEDLEMKPTVRHSVQVPPSASATKRDRPTSDTESIHRLHPGHSRRASDPSRSARPPRTSSYVPGIPPVPALPALALGSAITTPDVFPSTASSASSVTMVPVASSASLAAKAATPIVLKVEEVSPPQEAELVTVESSSDDEPVTMKTASQVTVTPIPASPTKNTRRSSKLARFTELEPIQSNTIVTISATTPPWATASDNKRRPTSTTTALPTSFDESALPAPKEFVLPTVAAPAPKTGKLSKSSPAPAGVKVKKNRWSLRSSKSTAVAV